jgi:GrpB-like predicted nucleotidyltransferase (UPF0157 family)
VPVNPGPAIILSHDPQWTERAAVLIATLRQALGARALRIDHIGSTAIPAMDAKDVLDVQVSVTDLDDAQEHFQAPLDGLGFARRPDRHDHVPAGRSDDPALWVKRYWRRRDASDDVNLHVRVSGSPNERLALLFRDWMCAHPDAVAAYSAFKRSLAATTPDVDTYTDVKDHVVDLVIVAAEEWASDTGWSTATRAAERRA